MVTGDGSSPQGATVVLIETDSAAESLIMLATVEDFGQRMSRVGADGRFAFDALPAGTYNVIAKHPAHPQAESGLLSVAANATVSDVTNRLGSGGALEGYAYRDGQPLTGALVVVLTGGVPATATTEENGYYYMTGLPAGTHQVALTQMGAGLDQLSGLRGAVVEIEEGRTTRHDFGGGSGTRIEGMCAPPPQLVGVALLRPPG